MPYVIRERRNTIVDYGTVPPEQWRMHERLVNWAKSLFDRSKAKSAPMFERYVSSDARAERREYGAATAVPVNREDAHKLGIAIGFLPEKNMKAINWFYVKGGRNPPAMASELGLTKQGLADCVLEARQILLNRNV